MQAIVDYGNEIVEQIVLTVVTSQVAAIALYKRFDFQIYGCEPRSLKSSEGYCDELLMVKFLKNIPLSA